jgi:siroheme synthase-like protein
MAQNLPVLLNVRGKSCLVVGGGAVALRKVKTLIEYGAKVRVVSPKTEALLADLANWDEITLEGRAFAPDDLEGVALVVAATDDPAVNATVLKEAKARGVLANVVDDPVGSDYTVPSYFEEGGVLITISTSGASPAVTRTLRRMLQEYLGKSFGAGLDIINAFREKEVKKKIPAAKDRVRFWEEALNPALLDLARQGDLPGLKQSLKQALEKFTAP